MVLWENADAIRQASEKEHTPFVLIKKFDVTMTVTVDAGAAPAIFDHPRLAARAARVSLSRRVRVDLQFVAGHPACAGKQHHPFGLSGATGAEQCADGVQPCTTITPTRACTFDIDPEKRSGRLTAQDAGDGDSSPRKRPHVVFTPAIARVVADDPWWRDEFQARQAKKDIRLDRRQHPIQLSRWSIRPFPISANIPGRTATAIAGRRLCFFITLCRSQGIPARWQTGWDTFSRCGRDIHGWSEIYLAPYGWVPVDPYMSTYATRYRGQIVTGAAPRFARFLFRWPEPVADGGERGS